ETLYLACYQFRDDAKKINSIGKFLWDSGCETFPVNLVQDIIESESVELIRGLLQFYPKISYVMNLIIRYSNYKIFASIIGNIRVKGEYLLKNCIICKQTQMARLVLVRGADVNAF